MRYIGVFILLLFMFSCQYFDKKKVDAEDLLNEELKTFNWNDVDQYPSFAVCDSASVKSQQKLCFETTLSSHINSKLNEALIVVTDVVNDTIMMEFQISEKGNISLKQLSSSTHIKEQIPHIDALLTQSIQNLPTIFPATKRGQQVKTEFRLPIVLKN